MTKDNVEGRRRFLGRVLLAITLGVVLGFISVMQQEPPGELVKPLTEAPQDRILVLAPHPDDDILGCAGVLLQALARNLPVRVVYLTYGDMNEWSFVVYHKRPVLLPRAVQNMGEVRRAEAIRAEAQLGLAAEDLIFLGYPDFGTMNIWYRHWNEAPAYRGFLTHAKAVPYPNAFRPGAPFKGEDIVEDLKTVIRDFKPTKIFVSHPGDHNADHRALYLFMKIALWDLKDEVSPKIYPYLIHFKSWPHPGHYHPRLPLKPPAFFDGRIQWSSIDLSDEEVAAKAKAIKAHRSQYLSSGFYLSSFVRRNELFGDFPTIRLAEDQQATIPSESKEALLKNSGHLTDNQKLSFVGVQDRTMVVNDGNLEITVRLSRPLGRALGTSIYLYGYRHDRSFKSMPKLRIKVGPVLYDVFDQRRKLSGRLIQVRRGFKKVTVIVPLEVLGNPQKILTSAQTYLGRVPLDWLSWRVIELQEESILLSGDAASIHKAPAETTPQ